jgi:hypothetical protein
MYRISVDTNLLKEQSRKILDSGRLVDSSGRDLLYAVQGIRSSHGRLIADAQRDALSVQNDSVLGLRPRGRRLGELGDELFRLAEGFDAVDHDVIDALRSRVMPLFMLFIDYPELGKRVHLINPDVVLLDAPQMRMVTCGSTVIHIGDPKNNSGNIWLTNGKFIKNIVGTYVDPDGNEYYVVIVGFDENHDPRLGYVRVTDNISGPVDYSGISFRKGTFQDGQTVDPSSLKSPWGRGDWPDIFLIVNPGWKEGPKQDFILGTSGLGIDGMRNSENHNLCGEFAVMSAVGEQNLRNGLEKFKNLGSKQNNILLADQQTGADELIPFFRAYGYDARQVPDGKMPTPSEVSNGIDDGKKYVILVDLDTNSGKVSTLDNTSGHHVGHWVTVTGVHRDTQGNIWVDVYNPYTNQVETYSWDTLCASSKNPGPSNKGGPVIIEAAPHDFSENYQKDIFH